MIDHESIDVPAVLASVGASFHGAQALFVGTVRDTDGGRCVTAVSYDCFRPLAERELAAIVAEAEARFGVRVAAQHRIGRVKVGEASLAVAAGSPHRSESFEACRWVVEQIKSRLPVWKQEHYVDGDSAWLDGCSLALSGVEAHAGR